MRRPRLARLSPEQAATCEERFFDCGLSHVEAWVLALVFVLTCALQLKPVLAGMAGVIALLGLIVASWSTPITAFYYIACSQVIPIPAAAPYNPAQIGFLAWLAILLVRRNKFAFQGYSSFWPFWLFFLWYFLVGGERAEMVSRESDYLKSALYALIACYYVNHSEGRYLKCLLGLCLGAATVMLAFWFRELNLPVELQEYTGALGRSGFGRLGAGRADSVMVWPPLLLGTFGIIGVGISLGQYRPGTRQANGVKWLSLGVFGLSLPPLVATMTHGAYAGFALLCVATGVALFQGLGARRMSLHGKRMMLRYLLLPLVAGAVVFSANMFKVQERTVGLWKHYQERAGTRSILDSRTEVWQVSLRTISRHPWCGVRFTEAEEEVPEEYRENREGYLSHNVFLDYGRNSGIPGLLLTAFFFAYPAVGLMRSPRRQRYLAFFLAYFVMFLFWMTLSYQFYKTFWGLWMLMSLALRMDHRLSTVGPAEPPPVGAGSNP